MPCESNVTDETSRFLLMFAAQTSSKEVTARAAKPGDR